MKNGKYSRKLKCDCKRKIEGDILEKFKENNKDHKKVSVSIDNGFFDMTFLIPFDVKSEAKLRNGGFKDSKISIKIDATYCPFCGDKSELIDNESGETINEADITENTDDDTKIDDNDTKQDVFIMLDLKIGDQIMADNESSPMVIDKIGERG